jgi:putative glutamine amidotransferase
VGRRYCEAIVRHGGVPVLICNNLSSIHRYSEILDGLLLSGTAIDVDPIFYGETFHHKTTITHPTRTQYDMAIAQKMLDNGKPVLGINYGCQLINVMHGGTLHQHMIEDVPTAGGHTQERLLVYPQHTVSVNPETRLYDLIFAADSIGAESTTNAETKCIELNVNSYHHQCIKTVGPGLRVAARATDGIIEGVEVVSGNFCMGVQWHAEFLSNCADYAIFKAFIEASANE